MYSYYIKATQLYVYTIEDWKKQETGSNIGVSQFSFWNFKGLMDNAV
jgi:hypothetical protein